jgi:hypothetical protein
MVCGEGHALKAKKLEIGRTTCSKELSTFGFIEPLYNTTKF